MEGKNLKNRVHIEAAYSVWATCICINMCLCLWFSAINSHVLNCTISQTQILAETKCFFKKVDYSLLWYVLSKVNSQLKQETEDNPLLDNIQRLKSVVFVLWLYCFPSRDRWTVTRDHVRVWAGVELKQLTQPPGSQMSWLAYFCSAPP